MLDRSHGTLLLSAKRCIGNTRLDSLYPELMPLAVLSPTLERELPMSASVAKADLRLQQGRQSMWFSLFWCLQQVRHCKRLKTSPATAVELLAPKPVGVVEPLDVKPAALDASPASNEPASIEPASIEPASIEPASIKPPASNNSPASKSMGRKPTPSSAGAVERLTSRVSTVGAFKPSGLLPSSLLPRTLVSLLFQPKGAYKPMVSASFSKTSI